MFALEFAFIFKASPQTHTRRAHEEHGQHEAIDGGAGCDWQGSEGPFYDLPDGLVYDAGTRQVGRLYDEDEIASLKDHLGIVDGHMGWQAHDEAHDEAGWVNAGWDAAQNEDQTTGWADDAGEADDAGWHSTSWADDTGGDGAGCDDAGWTTTRQWQRGWRSNRWGNKSWKQSYRQVPEPATPPRARLIPKQPSCPPPSGVIGMAKLKAKAKVKKVQKPEAKAMPVKDASSKGDGDIDEVTVAKTLETTPSLANDIIDEMSALWDEAGGNTGGNGYGGAEADWCNADGEAEAEWCDADGEAEWCDDNSSMEPPAKKTKRGTKNRGGRKIQMHRLQALLRSIQNGSSASSSSSSK